MNDFLIQLVVQDLGRLVGFTCRRRTKHTDLRDAARRALGSADPGALRTLIDGALNRGSYTPTVMRACARLDNVLDDVYANRDAVVRHLHAGTERKRSLRFVRFARDGSYECRPSILPARTSGLSEVNSDRKDS